MSFGWDVVPTPQVAAALVAGGVIPLFLAVLAVVPVLRRRTGWRMAVAGLTSLSLWVAWGSMFGGAQHWIASADGATSLLIIASAWVAFLILWGSITRGYTFALLMTVYDAGRPLPPPDVEKAYARNRGLRFLMEKRVSGLISLGLVRQERAELTLTKPWGVLVARGYQFAIRIFGLRRTG